MGMMKYRNTIKILIPVLWLLFLIISAGCYLEQQDDDPPLFTDIYQLPSGPEETWVPGNIIVRIDSSVPAAEVDALVPGTRVKTVSSPDNTSYLLYNLDDPQDTGLVLAMLMSNGRVLYAEKNAIYALCDLVPDDAYYEPYQYAPRITNCEAAWEIEQGEAGITVAVLDTGINGAHEELEGRVVAGRNVVTGTDIAAGVNSDHEGHGSHVAGIIAARGNNGTGIAGVAWNINLMPVKIFDVNVYTTTVHISEGVIWAVDHGADVISMSFGSELYSMAVNDVVNYAHQHGVVLVAAMGNSFRYQLSFPAALPGVIGIGASNGRDEVAFFSSSGNHISVVAPGESIFSLKYDGNANYMYASGTSMAAPFVSGLAALLLSSNPSLTPGEVRSMIEDSADPLGESGFTPEYGYGRVNAYNALTITPRDNYQNLSVDITNRGQPVGGVKVLLQNMADSTIVQSGMTSYGGMQGGLIGRIIFNHIRPGDYRVLAQVGSPQVIDVTLAPGGGDMTVAFAFDASMVLIVNGIKNADMSQVTDEYLYTQKLSAMGKYYTLWKSAYHGPPTIELVGGYDMVIWYTGKMRNNSSMNIEVLTASERDVIRTYLDSGGLLYLCGNNLAEYLANDDPGFLAAYLHAGYVTSPLSHEDMRGAGLLDGMELTIYREDADQISVEPGAIPILDASDEVEENHWAGLTWENGYRLVYTTICPNDIIYCNPNNFFETIIGWLDAGN